jgi:hypothetical protein
MPLPQTIQEGQKEFRAGRIWYVGFFPLWSAVRDERSRRAQLTHSRRVRGFHSSASPSPA